SLCARYENPIPARTQGCRLLQRQARRPADSSNALRPESAGYEMAGALSSAQRLDELLLVHSRPALDASLLGPAPQLRNLPVSVRCGRAAALAGLPARRASSAAWRTDR